LVKKAYIDSRIKKSKDPVEIKELFKDKRSVNNLNIRF